MRVSNNRVLERKANLIKDYSKMGFNWQCVIRIKNNQDLMIDKKYHRTYVRTYNSKMTTGYIERVMDNLAKRRTIDVVAAFLEQDNYFANHLHFAWRCPIELTRDQIAKTMRTRVSFLRDVMPIEGEKAALEYFTKRLYAKGSYNNLFV
jgi:hypothetical protein